MRAHILALLLLALASSRQAFAAETFDTIDAMKKNCLSGTSAPAWSAGANTAECEQCVEDIGNLDGLDSQRMYACYDVCQSDELMFSAFDCIDCISNPAYTVTACKACMNPALGFEGSSACYSCLADDPWEGEDLTQAEQYKRDSYFYACSQCASIPTAAGARAQCLQCIKTKQATPQGGLTQGILSYAELNSENYTPRDNDFGTCVFLANQTYLISIGSVAAQGIYANCVPEGYNGGYLPLTVGSCMACMSDVEGMQLQASSDTPLKSYGCADYCQKPDNYPTGTEDAKTALATECVNCLKNPSITQAWACGNCLKSANPSVCFQCVSADPYSGNTSNYNWACGKCADIDDENLRNLCLECIQNQPGAGAGDTNSFTESNICSCIDLVQRNEYAVNRTLTAMERTCFEPFTRRDSDGNLLTPLPIPWGDDTLNRNTSECLNCMKLASDGASLPGLNKAYACHEYCQNPALVNDEQQGLDCAVCVASDAVTDPWACQVCMTATSETPKRQDCFTCLRATSEWPSHSWGCGQCAQFSNDTARAACYQCLSTDDVDPCACVDGVKNGTIVYKPLPQATGPAYLTCEGKYATIACTDDRSAIAGYVIKSITNVLYGRRFEDTTTCLAECQKEYPSFSCPNVFGTQTAECGLTLQASYQNLLDTQCVGQTSCNILYANDEYYALQASPTVDQFNGVDPCTGIYKYLVFDFECGPASP